MKEFVSHKGFDRLSGIYDQLVKIVFGNSLNKAQVVHLCYIPKGSRVLVLGGGTGWILEELLSTQQQCQVTYIEASKGMLDRSKARNIDVDKVSFILGTETNIPHGKQYDIVITNFYLDLFGKASIECVLERLVLALKPGGSWIVTDFVKNDVFWQSGLLWMMHRFFQLCCGIEANQLLNFSGYFNQLGFKRKKQAGYFHNMVDSSIWIKPKGP